MTITNRDSRAREISRSIGMVFQNFNLFPHMTALENHAGPRRVLKKSRGSWRSGCWRRSPRRLDNTRPTSPAPSAARVPAAAMSCFTL